MININKEAIYMPQTHLIRNCPKGSNCDQTWESLKVPKHGGFSRTCSNCKQEVWEVTKYPISPFLLEHDLVIAIDYEITDLKKMIDGIGQPIRRSKIPNLSDEQRALKNLVKKNPDNE
jgi:hypothetical protein